MNIPQEIKDEVIRLTKETTMHVKAILQYISKDFKLNFEDYYKILDEYENETGIRIQRGMDKSKLKEEVTDELLTSLCKKGFSYEKIRTFLIENGYLFKRVDIEERAKNIYNKLGLKRIPKKRRKKEPLISEQELINLHNNGWTYKQMSQHLERKNIRITPQNLQRLVSEIYKKKGEKIPRKKKKTERIVSEKKKRIEEKDFETIFNLREQKMTYSDIAEYFIQLGYSVSASKIAKLCKKIYSQKEKNEPVIKKQKPKFDIEELKSMKEMGWKLKQVIEYYKAKGLKFSENYLRYKYGLIKLTNRDDVENLIQKGKRLLELIPDKAIIELRAQGMSYEKIKQYYKSKGIIFSISYIKNRIKRIEARGKIDITTIPEEKLNAILLNLKESKGATDEQLQKLAEFYGFTYYNENEDRINPYIVKKLNEER